MFTRSYVNNGRLTHMPAGCNLQCMKKKRRAWKILIITVSVLFLRDGQGTEHTESG